MKVDALLISIITVNLNNLEGLKKTMTSVFEQTWQEFEYIIIDGGSKDGSREYIESNNDKIDHWVSEPDKGIYNGMNKGIKTATGDYLLFLNSGDELSNKTILQEITSSNSFDRDLIYTNLIMVDKNKEEIKKYPHILNFSFFYKTSLPHPSTFIKSSLFYEERCYDEELKIVADWKFFMDSLCKHNATYKKVPKALSRFYLDGISSGKENYIKVKIERDSVLNSDYSMFLRDYKKFTGIKKKLSELRLSRKLNLLIKLGFIKKI